MTTVNINTGPITSHAMACKLKEIENQIADLQNQLYSNYYKKKLYGFSVFISNTVHKLPFIKGFLVIKPTGEVVSIAEKIFSDQSIQLDSNVLLDNHILILY